MAELGVTDSSDAISAPKVLLHDHLDGGLRIATIVDLAAGIGWTLLTGDPDELQRWFTAGAEARDLSRYLATFDHTLAVMQTEEAIERVAFECAVDLAADGVLYAEVRFAPELHQRCGLPLDNVVSAVTAGLRRGEREAERDGRSLVVNVIVCAMRTERRSDEVVELVERMRWHDPKVVGFDLAGAETGWPPSMHADALQYARERHINVTIHASEPPDLELIDDAVAQGAHRIGHGVRLRRDITVAADGSVIFGRLAQFVLDRQIHLEMAPTCHVQVGAVPDLPSHPIATLLRHGFNVGINTDNRLMSNVTPSSELLAVATTFELTGGEAERLALNAIRSAFAPYEVRQRIEVRVRDGFARFRDTAWIPGLRS